MPFDAAATEQQITNSMGAMLLLHASNQALIEVAITPSASPWYNTLDQELGAVENLIIQWRQNGFLYFQQEILQQVVSCGQAFVNQQVSIDALFQRLENAFNAPLKQQIVTAMMALESPINAMVSQLTTYVGKLQAYEKAMETPHHNMLVTVAQIQAEASNIQAQITSINAQIASLKQQVITDRQAIAKAERSRTSGIIETIFGVLLAPLTGGASLILAGIGVATLAEAQEKVNQLQSEISGYQGTIASDQQSLSSDEKQIATLQGLTMSVELALSDILDLDNALDSLQTTWGVLLGELQNAVQDVQNASTSQAAIVSQVWFDAACGTWQNVINFAQLLANNNAPNSNHVTIG
jgi:predicted  nucleic acid-binding Zn-ribbon protein